ncbi:glutamate decarboxylase isozyme [Shigella dysenteriae 1617]|nr:glutamate decarboxylase isozyme [Shigella dysenteriae 1617]
MTVTAAKSVMAFRVLTMAVDLCRLTTRTMNVNAGHERTSKSRIIHQIQLIRGITKFRDITCQINRHCVVRVYRGKTKFWLGRTYTRNKKQDSSNLK